MTIKRITEFTKEELKSMQTAGVQFSCEPIEGSLVLEIVTSYLPLNEGENKLYSTIGIYNNDQLIYHEVYRETLTPSQILEATNNITSYPERYVFPKNASYTKSLN